METGFSEPIRTMSLCIFFRNQPRQVSDRNNTFSHIYFLLLFCLFYCFALSPTAKWKQSRVDENIKGPVYMYGSLLEAEATDAHGQMIN